MAKRLSFGASPLLLAYVDEILKRGLHGSTRTEVVRQLVCRSLMESLSGETIRRIVEEQKKAQ